MRVTPKAGRPPESVSLPEGVSTGVPIPRLVKVSWASTTPAYAFAWYGGTNHANADDVKVKLGKTTKDIDAHCQPDDAGAALLKQAAARLGLSARAFHRVQKIARTIADLAGVADVNKQHIAEAVGYRLAMKTVN